MLTFQAGLISLRVIPTFDLKTRSRSTSTPSLHAYYSSFSFWTYRSYFLLGLYSDFIPTLP